MVVLFKLVKKSMHRLTKVNDSLFNLLVVASGVEWRKCYSLQILNILKGMKN